MLEVKLYHHEMSSHCAIGFEDIGAILNAHTHHYDALAVAISPFFGRESLHLENTSSFPSAYIIPVTT